MSGGEKRRRIEAVVTGRVQAVGFRDFVRREAQRRGISGHVRNGDDGRTVEVVAEAADDALDGFIDALRRGPSLARVDNVNVDRLDATGEFDGFRVVF